MKSTEFKIYSHACMEVRTLESSVLIDPWLIGSCYWRSWWNYPPVNREEVNNLRVDAIYLTHLHWDHWHGPSLKKLFPKDTLIITHDEPNKRSVKDLIDIGFKNVKILKHGEDFKIGDISITPYQFGLFLNDSALVVETPDAKFLNANDCKIAGPSLRYIIKKHGPFDFALRSHSSANDRVCYSLKTGELANDDTNHYSRSFALFMNAVKPKFAIPFASNHCHLHKDVFDLNYLVNDPYKLQEYINQKDLLEDVQIKVMLSGDSWSSNKGFNLNNANKNYFEQKDVHLRNYRDLNQEKLENYYNLERRLKPNNEIIKMFEKQILSIPFLLRFRFKDFSYKMTLFNDTEEYHYNVTPKNGRVSFSEEDFDSGASIRIPIKVFLDSVVMNMFHHSSISKRNKYIFNTERELREYEKFQDLLEYVELGVFPLRVSYIVQLVQSYVRRWRELIVYAHALILVRKGMRVYEVEEEILKVT